MLKNGYIKLYRSLLDWEWYDDTVTKCLFLHLLLTVNAYDEDWKELLSNAVPVFPHIPNYPRNYILQLSKFGQGYNT